MRHPQPGRMPMPEPGLITRLEPGRKGEILDAALGVFAEKGYAAGSMRDIAARVGVTEPALYRHFPGKQALFLALVRFVAKQLQGEAVVLLDDIRPDGLRTQIASALADRRRAIEVFAPVLRTLFATAIHDPAALQEVRDSVVTPIRGHLSAKVAELDAAYGIESDEASREARVRAFMSLFVGSLATSVVVGDQPDEAMADAIVRVMGWEGKA